MVSFFQTHQPTLENALEAIRKRDFWSPYPEVASGKIYGETAKEDGIAAFKARLGKTFDLPGHPSDRPPVGAEASPYGYALDIKYPGVSPDLLIETATAAAAGWAASSIEDRIGVCMEILHRLNAASFEMAHAVSQTTGQAFMMAFQAGGPHAQDRGLEAVAYAYSELRQALFGLSHKASTTRSSWKRPTVSFLAAWPSPSAVRLSPPGTAIPASLPVWRPGIR